MPTSNEMDEAKAEMWIAVDDQGDGWIMKATGWLYNETVLDGNSCDDNGVNFPASKAGLYHARGLKMNGDSEGGLLSIDVRTWTQIAAIP